jgi:glutathione S-transferase
MSFTLYNAPPSTCSQRVRFVLNAKKLPFEEVKLDLMAGDQMKPDYLKLNPNGVVPTLVHDGTPIINSFCNNEYINDVFPEPPLLPKDPVARARARYWAWTADDVHHPAARLTHAKQLRPRVMLLPRADQEKMLNSTPVPDKRERWRTLIDVGYSDKQIDEAVESVLFVFGRMEEELKARGPWLAGPTFSLGDINMLAIVHRTFEIYPDRIKRVDFPRMLDWWDRALARPAAKLVYTEGTEEVPSRPKGQSVEGIAEFRV